MIPTLLAPLLTTLASNGLGLLSNVIQEKGKEAVERIIGVRIPDKPNQDELSALRQAMMLHEEKLQEFVLRKVEAELEAEKSAAESVTRRWEADMKSDSWLAKNIRPLTLIFILAAYSVFALLSAFGVSVNEAYVSLLGQWGMLIMSAYFVGRTVEKVVTTKAGGNHE